MCECEWVCLTLTLSWEEEVGAAGALVGDAGGEGVRGEVGEAGGGSGEGVGSWGEGEGAGEGVGMGGLLVREETNKMKSKADNEHCLCVCTWGGLVPGVRGRMV